MSTISDSSGTRGDASGSRSTASCRRLRAEPPCPDKEDCNRAVNRIDAQIAIGRPSV